MIVDEDGKVISDENGQPVASQASTPFPIAGIHARYPAPRLPVPALA